VTKAQVGLPNCDNTSDADKPVSTAQATAIALKASLTGAAFTGATSVTTTDINIFTLTNPDAASYTRIKYVGTGTTFACGVGNASATITSLRNKFYVYDSTGAKPLVTIASDGTINLPTQTASTVLVLDASKNLVASTTTAVELSHVHGVTGAIQTQLNAKAETLSVPVYIDSSTTTAYTIQASDAGKTIICLTTTATIALTWPALSVGTSIAVVNIGTGLVTNTASGTAFDLSATTLSGSNASAVFEYRTGTQITNVGRLV
jgi:hypothetical protein